MLASGKNSVLASVIPDITDNGEELFKKGFTNDPKVIMELKSSDIDKTMLLKKFANWFESHNHPPSFIVIKNLGSIAIRVPSENEKPLSGLSNCIDDKPRSMRIPFADCHPLFSICSFSNT